MQSTEYCIYLRKSRADFEAESHGEGETLARHKKALLELAQNLHLTITEVYEEVVSGESIDARPQVRKLLQSVEQRRFVGVLCMDIDRLARGDTIDQGIIARAFRMSGTKIITPKKTYDPTSEFDEEYFEFELFMSRREYKMISRRIQRGRVASVKEGRFIGSTPPYGYDKVKIPNDKGYTLAPNSESDTVKMIYRLYLDGNGKYAIAQKLDGMGITPRNRSTWSSSTVSDILKNPVYTGKIRWSYRPDVKDMTDGIVTKRRVKNEDCILVDGLHPPLISEKDFDEVQALFKRRSVPPKKADTSLKNPLSGLVFCAKCGAVMSRLGENRRSFKATLRCSNPHCDTVSSKLELVEGAVLESLENWLIEYKIKISNKSPLPQNNDSGDIQKTINALSTEIKQTEKQIDNIYNLLEQGVYTVEIFKQRSAALSKKLSELNEALSEAQQLANKIHENKVMHATIIPRMEKVIESYKNAESVEEKNRLLKSVIRRVDYSKTKPNTRANPDLCSFNLTLEPLLPD